VTATPGQDSCGCPETDGKIYHQRGTCTDPVAAALDWYADGPVQPAATPGQADEFCGETPRDRTGDVACTLPPGHTGQHERDTGRSIMRWPVPVTWPAAQEPEDETPGYWKVRAALAAAVGTLNLAVLSTDTDLAVKARETLAKVDSLTQSEAGLEVATPGRVLLDSLRNSAVAEFGLAVEDFATWEQIPESQRIRMEAAAQDIIADDRAVQAPGIAMRIRELRQAIRDRNEYLDGLNFERSQVIELRARLSSLTNRAEAAGVITGDEAAGYRTAPGLPS
jgi:hypothetical protein